MWLKLSDRIKRLFAYGVVIAAFCGILYRQEQQDETAAMESAERIHQICLVFERQHFDDVESLKNLYAYLAALPEDEKKLTLNKFILAALPEREKTANTDNAPPFCDRPNRGLPEPDPVVPKRPAELKVNGPK